MKLRVLIVDDAPVFRKVFAATLRAFLQQVEEEQFPANDLTIKQAQNAEKALELCAEEEFDVIITDYDMPPGENGYQLACKIRESKGLNANTPILGITGASPEELQKRQKEFSNLTNAVCMSKDEYEKGGEERQAFFEELYKHMQSFHPQLVASGSNAEPPKCGL